MFLGLNLPRRKLNRGVLAFGNVGNVNYANNGNDLQILNIEALYTFRGSDNRPREYRTGSDGTIANTLRYPNGLTIKDEDYSGRDVRSNINRQDGDGFDYPFGSGPRDILNGIILAPGSVLKCTRFGNLENSDHALLEGTTTITIDDVILTQRTQRFIPPPGFNGKSFLQDRSIFSVWAWSFSTDEAGGF